jgi:HEAT repeat protein
VPKNEEILLELQDRDPEVRAEAINQLPKSSLDKLESEGILRGKLDDTDRRVRGRAAEVAAKMRFTALIPKIVKLLYSSNEGDEHWYASALPIKNTSLHYHQHYFLPLGIR